MKPFTTLEAVAAPWLRANVNTDMIIRGGRSGTVPREELGRYLLEAVRLREDGSEDPSFILNRPAFREAQILIGGDNFGCGSSREHAPWALTQFGFRAVISTSFADIFKNNSLKNSLLPIIVPQDVHAKLFALPESATVKVDLASQRLILPDGTSVEFPVDPFSKTCLLEGVDELGWILNQSPAIADFEATRVGSINTLSY